MIIRNLKTEFGENSPESIDQIVSRIIENSNFENTPTFFKMFKAHVLAFNFQKYDDAIAIYDTIPNAYNESDYLEEIGFIYSLKKENDKALEIYHRALQMNNFGKNMFISKDGKEKFHESRAGKLQVLRQMGIMYMNKDKFEESIDYFSMVLAIEPKDVYSLAHISWIYSIQGDNKTAKQVLENAMAIDKDHFYSNMASCQIATSEKRFSEATKSLIAMLREVYENRDGNNPINLGTLAYYFQSIYMNKYAETGSITPLIRMVTDSIKENNAEKFAGMFAMKMIEHFGESLRGRELSEGFSTLLKMDPQINFPENQSEIYRFFGVKSKNKVFSTDFEFLKLSVRDYIIKIGDKKSKDSINDEYWTNQWLNLQITDVLNNKNSKYRLPVNYFICNSENHTILIEETFKAKNVEKSLKSVSKKEGFDMINRSLYFLGILHSIGSKNLELDNEGYYFKISDGQNNSHTVQIQYMDYWNNFMRRILGDKNDKYPRLGKNKKFKEFLYSIRKHIGELDIAYFTHGDAYPHNVLSNGAWIDLEKKRIGDPTLDVAQFTCNHVIYDTNLIDLYLQNLSSIEKEFKVQPNEFSKLRKRYSKNVLYDNICQIGSMLSINDMPHAQFYLQKSLDQMDGNLKDKFVDYIMATKHDGLKKVLR